MRNRGTILIISVCIVLISAGSAAGISADFAVGDPENHSVQADESSRLGNRFISGEGEIRMNSLISLLQDIGPDISYGDDGGTIFSMVDQSLTRIIIDLSSGNTEGFMDIPLIQETLKYLGITSGDIIVNPEDVPYSMEAIDRYNQRYPVNQSVSP